MSAIERAADSASQVRAAENLNVDFPESGLGTATLSGTAGSVSMEIPAEGKAIASTDASVLFQGTDEDSLVALESTASGLRALVHLESESAPEQFKFPFGGNVASLDQNSDGSVRALDVTGELVAIIDRPWAVDLDGTKVPTHFEIEGTTLIQVVRHKNGGFAHGITADPSVWQITKQRQFQSLLPALYFQQPRF